MTRPVRRNAGAGPRIGALVADRYRLEEHLGEGGMAQVFRAYDVLTDRRVAVKILRRDVAMNPEAVERAKREGELLSQLDNPAIVSVETWGELADGTVFLVMELLEGETLGMRMRRSTMDPAELAPIVAGTCAGLHAAHSRGIVHRDLKPDNIFLCPTEYGLQVKLLDFGISKVYGGEKLTQTGEVLGTPRYMSPEQLGAEPDVDGRVDVYALGVILYEALAGKPPFLGTTPTDLIIAILNGKVAPLRSVRPDLPSAVEAVVMRAMSKVRAARFDTAMALAEAYIDAAGGVAKARGQERRGTATRAMGGMRVGPSSTPPPAFEPVPDTRPPEPRSDIDDIAGNLRLGTFSGLEMSATPLGAVERGAIRGSQHTTVSAGAALPVRPDATGNTNTDRDSNWVAHAATQAVAAAEPSQARTVPKTRETPVALLSESPAPVKAPRVVPATTVMESSRQPASAPVAMHAQTSGAAAKVMLLLGALLAGAASAAAVVVGLHLYDQHVEDAQPENAPKENRGVEQQQPATRRVEPPPEAQPEELPTPPSTSSTSLRATESPRRSIPARNAPRRRSTRERVQPEEGQPNRSVAPGQAVVGTPSDPLAEAQRALHTGHPQRCVAILSDLLSRRGGGASALRRRGDCLEAAGQRSAAIADYRRFCRLFGDDPAIGEVRSRLESWGHTCP